MHRTSILITIAIALGAATACRTFYDAHPTWTAEELALVQSLSLSELPSLRPDPSNRVADDQRAAELGRELFFDVRFSANGKVACATCHLPDRQFQDDFPLARGIGTTGRRTMPISGMAYAPFLFWDGRKDSLWAQALGPLESAVEHGGNRTRYAHIIAEHYSGKYETLFGPLPNLASFPANAGPVADPLAAAAWQDMPEESRTAVSTVFANVGKAIAAYERTILPQQTRFDAWVAEPTFPDSTLLSSDEVAGLRLFVGKGECVNCHNGPLLTDNYFHNTGVPQALGLPHDRGRAEGARFVLADEFNCLGRFSDAVEEDCAELRFMAAPGHDAERAFKTPSLRGASSRAPFMHAGQLATLDDVLAHYSAAPTAPEGHSELRAKAFTEEEKLQLSAFLATLDPEKD